MFFFKQKERSKACFAPFWWRWWELNPRPKTLPHPRLRAQPVMGLVRSPYASPARRKARYSVSPLCYRKLTQSFPGCRRRVLSLRVSSGRRRCAETMPRMRSWFCFCRLFLTLPLLTKTRQLRLATDGSASPSKPVHPLACLSFSPYATLFLRRLAYVLSSTQRFAALRYALPMTKNPAQFLVLFRHMLRPPSGVSLTYF